MDRKAICEWTRNWFDTHKGTSIHDFDLADMIRNFYAAKLASLGWSEITPENLPRVGDEARGKNRNVLEIEEWHIGYFTADPRVWLQSGYTHRRPINAPSS